MNAKGGRPANAIARFIVRWFLKIELGKKQKYEFTKFRTAYSECCIWTFNCSAIDAVNDASRSYCGWTSNALMAKRAGFPHLGSSEYVDVDVETR
jgi:hypothetical protein